MPRKKSLKARPRRRAKKSATVGYKNTFHGAFVSETAAARKARKVGGWYTKKHLLGHRKPRFVVMTDTPF